MISVTELTELAVQVKYLTFGKQVNINAGLNISVSICIVIFLVN